MWAQVTLLPRQDTRTLSVFYASLYRRLTTLLCRPCGTVDLAMGFPIYNNPKRLLVCLQWDAISYKREQQFTDGTKLKKPTNPVSILVVHSLQD